MDEMAEINYLPINNDEEFVSQTTSNKNAEEAKNLSCNECDFVSRIESDLLEHVSVNHAPSDFISNTVKDKPPTRNSIEVLRKKCQFLLHQMWLLL